MTDVGSRLTEMLDEQPGQGEPNTMGIDEAALITDYGRVQSGEITDATTVRRLASMFASVANDAVLVKQVSFDAVHAALQLYAHADKL